MRDGQVGLHLLKLITLILENKVNRVFVAYRDRLTRFGFNYLKTIADFHSVEIIVVSSELSEKPVQEELAEDLVAIIHSFSGKLYGMRRKVLKKFEKDITELTSKMEVYDDTD